MADEVDDTAAPEADGKHKGLVHGKHATEILVVCSVVTVVLGYMTLKGSKGSGTAQLAAGAPLAPGGAAGNVAGFDAASVQGLSDQMQTLAQAQAGAFQNFSDAIGAQTQAQNDAATGLQTAITNQGSQLSTLTTTISALPGEIAHVLPAPIAAPAPAAPAAPSGNGGPQWVTVHSGDTLTGIAARYPSASITAGSIGSLNGIRNLNVIRPGQTLRIY